MTPFVMLFPRLDPQTRDIVLQVLNGETTYISPPKKSSMAKFFKAIRYKRRGELYFELTEANYPRVNEIPQWFIDLVFERYEREYNNYLRSHFPEGADNLGINFAFRGNNLFNLNHYLLSNQVNNFNNNRNINIEYSSSEETSLTTAITTPGEIFSYNTLENSPTTDIPRSLSSSSVAQMQQRSLAQGSSVVPNIAAYDNYVIRTKGEPLSYTGFKPFSSTALIFKILNRLIALKKYPSNMFPFSQSREKMLDGFLCLYKVQMHRRDIKDIENFFKSQEYRMISYESECVLKSYFGYINISIFNESLMIAFDIEKETLCAAHSLMMSEYWNFKNCLEICNPEQWKASQLISIPLSTPEIRPHKIEEYSKYEFTVLDTIYRVFHKQDERDENLRYMHFYKLKTSKMPVTIQPIVWIGIFQYKIRDDIIKDDNLLFPNYFFKKFNEAIETIEMASLVEISKNPLFSNFKVYSGPKFEITFNTYKSYDMLGNKSQEDNSWCMFKMVHIFAVKDLIYVFLSSIVSEVYRILKEKTNDVCCLSSKLHFLCYDIKRLLPLWIDHFSVKKNLKLYLGCSIYGIHTLINVDVKNKYLEGINTNFITNFQKGDNCRICLSNYINGEFCLTLTKCGHKFHKECILRWLSSKVASSKTCPICRASIS